MTPYPNNTLLIQSLSELPSLDSREIILDFETSSGDPKLDSLNPWHNCRIAGVCICDNNSPGYYIPIGHKSPTPHVQNLDKSAVARWLFDILQNCDILVGHNIKYDAHVLKNDLGVDYSGTLYDTLTQAKVLRSDRMSYGLDALSKDWLGCDISRYEAAMSPYLYNGRGHKVNKDYGAIPADVMAPYGGQDVLTTRDLKRYIMSHMPESCKLVSDNEVKLTRILLEMENVGMQVDPTKVKIKQVETGWRLIQIIGKIQELTGIDIRPNTTDDCYRFLCGQYGLPVLKWTNEDDPTKESNPSFDKEAMTNYKHLPQVVDNAILAECIELIHEYRVLDTFNSLFLNTFIARNVDGKLHSDYNQCVSTGRLSCSDPNAQQMSDLAKGLIEVPDKDWVIVDVDLSQIDYRVVVSATNNTTVVNRYNTDASTDFHALVADMVGITRRHGKTLNLAIGFGMGKKSAVNLVKKTFSAKNQDYIDSGMHFDDYCESRSLKMYKDYHQMLPELKKTSQQSTAIATKLGYIANLYGRRRYFPEPRRMMYKGKEKYVSFYHRAFASYVQSSAADLAKGLTIRIDELLSTKYKDVAMLVAVVHDSWVLYAHKDVYMSLCIDISRLIRQVKDLRVPVLNSCKVSKSTWASCKTVPNLEFSI